MHDANRSRQSSRCSSTCSFGVTQNGTTRHRRQRSSGVPAADRQSIGDADLHERQQHFVNTEIHFALLQRASGRPEEQPRRIRILAPQLAVDDSPADSSLSDRTPARSTVISTPAVERNTNRPSPIDCTRPITDDPSLSSSSCVTSGAAISITGWRRSAPAQPPRRTRATRRAVSRIIKAPLRSGTRTSWTA